MKNTASESAQEQLTKSQDDTDFTLKNHYLERIKHHMKMLNYYLNETVGA
jgi:hypothetical protein